MIPNYLQSLQYYQNHLLQSMGNQIGVTEATGETWKSIKKSASGPFSLTRLKKYISVFNECYKHMLEFIDGQLDGGNNVVHSSDIFPNISMDVLAAIGLGVHINSFKLLI